MYPNVNWESTKKTKDGNKDGEAQYMAPLNSTIKYWYEAKYSKNTSKGIPKSHLDSTLVSCSLDGKVVFIAFITNAYISDDYRRRADIFSKQRDNLKIIYINGVEIEDWLYENPDIELKYFSKNTAEHQNFKDYIVNACVLQGYDLYGNNFSKIKNVECGKEYTLYLSIFSSCKQVGFLSSKNDEIEPLRNDNKKYDQYDKLELNLGYNSLYIPIKINRSSDIKPILNYLAIIIY